ncbi:MAG: hypothetical protein R3C29_15430 [Dehalococcoidia bacterium]
MRNWWEESELASAGGEPLGRYLETADYHAPGLLRLEDSRLRWENDLTVAPSLRIDRPGSTAVSQKILEQFLRLADANDAAVLRMARRWGPLYLEDDFRPFDWESSNYWRRGLQQFHPLDSEPVEGWRAYSRLADALLRIANALRQEETVTNSMRRAVVEAGVPGLSWLVDVRRPATNRGFVHYLVARWLEAGQVSLEFSWEADRPALKFGGRLFGFLGYQIAAAVAGTRGIAICSACCRPYFRTNKAPKAGQANFCPDAPCQAESHNWRRRNPIVSPKEENE